MRDPETAKDVEDEAVLAGANIPTSAPVFSVRRPVRYHTIKSLIQVSVNIINFDFPESAFENSIYAYHFLMF